MIRGLVVIMVVFLFSCKDGGRRGVNSVVQEINADASQKIQEPTIFESKEEKSFAQENHDNLLVGNWFMKESLVADFIFTNDSCFVPMEMADGDIISDGSSYILNNDVLSLKYSEDSIKFFKVLHLNEVKMVLVWGEDTEPLEYYRDFAVREITSEIYTDSIRSWSTYDEILPVKKSFFYHKDILPDEAENWDEAFLYGYVKSKDSTGLLFFQLLSEHEKSNYMCIVKNDRLKGVGQPLLIAYEDYVEYKEAVFSNIDLKNQTIIRHISVMDSEEIQQKYSVDEVGIVVDN